MKTTVSIPDEIFKQADSLAQRLGASRGELYASALESYIQRYRGEKITEALDQVYSTERSALDPVAAAIQWPSIPRDEW